MDTAFAGIFDGAQACISVSMAGALFGFVFGVLAHTKGISVYNAALMSAVVYAGAAQMVSLGMWGSQHVPTLALVGTSFVICLRHILMGAAIRQHLCTYPAWRVYPTLFFMVDESWALTMLQIRQVKRSHAYYNGYLFGTGFLFYLAWQVSTIAGNLFGQHIADPKRLGFDFAFAAIFLALLVGMWRGKHDGLPWIVAAGVSVLSAYFIPGNWYIILGALAGSLTGVMVDRV